MQGQFTFMGTGGSLGSPIIGCQCQVCTSSSPFNHRLRSSGLLRLQGKTFVIDVGPDFRQQALTYNLSHLTGVLLTHAHTDHIAGIDDLRAYGLQHKEKLPILLSSETFDEVKMRFHYFFNENAVSPQFSFHILDEDFGEVEFQKVRFGVLTYFQPPVKVNGFRVGNFAYVSDIREFSDRVFEALKGVEILVLSALRHQPTAMHFSLEEAISFSRRTSAKMTYLTHLGHDFDYEEINRILPAAIRLSYDGLEIPIEYL